MYTQEEKDKEQINSTIFCFIVLCIAISGYMYESYTYHPYNSLIPNIPNILSQHFLHFNIMPDETGMFLSDYYIKQLKNETINEYINRVPSEFRIENKIWGGWLYMIMMFTPLFIISCTGIKVKKIDKEKIRKFIIFAKQYIKNNSNIH